MNDTDAATLAAPTAPAAKPRPRGEWRETAKSVALVVLVFLAVRIAVFQQYRFHLRMPLKDTGQFRAAVSAKAHNAYRNLHE